MAGIISKINSKVLGNTSYGKVLRRINNAPTWKKVVGYTASKIPFMASLTATAVEGAHMAPVHVPLLGPVDAMSFMIVITAAAAVIPWVAAIIPAEWIAPNHDPLKTSTAPAQPAAPAAPAQPVAPAAPVQPVAPAAPAAPAAPGPAMPAPSPAAPAAPAKPAAPARPAAPAVPPPPPPKSKPAAAPGPAETVAGKQAPTVVTPPESLDPATPAGGMNLEKAEAMVSAPKGAFTDKEVAGAQKYIEASHAQTRHSSPSAPAQSPQTPPGVQPVNPEPVKPAPQAGPNQVAHTNRKAMAEDLLQKGKIADAARFLKVVCSDLTQGEKELLDKIDLALKLREMRILKENAQLTNDANIYEQLLLVLAQVIKSPVLTDAQRERLESELKVLSEAFDEEAKTVIFDRGEVTQKMGEVIEDVVEALEDQEALKTHVTVTGITAEELASVGDQDAGETSSRTVAGTPEKKLLEQSDPNSTIASDPRFMAAEGISEHLAKMLKELDDADPIRELIIDLASVGEVRQIFNVVETRFDELEKGAGDLAGDAYDELNDIVAKLDEGTE